MKKIVREAAFRIRSEGGMDEQQMKNFIQSLLEELQERDLQELTPTNEEKNEWAKEGYVWDARSKKFLYEI